MGSQWKKRLPAFVGVTLGLAIAGVALVPHSIESAGDGRSEHERILEAAGPVPVVKAEALSLLWNKNSVAWKTKYDGKRFAVVGDVQTVGENLLGEAVVAIEAMNGENVQCSTNEEQLDLVKRLRPGNRVALVGLLEERATLYTHFGVRDCEVLPLP